MNESSDEYLRGNVEYYQTHPKPLEGRTGDLITISARAISSLYFQPCLPADNAYPKTLVRITKVSMFPYVLLIQASFALFPPSSDPPKYVLAGNQ